MIGERLADIRKDHGDTQAALAQRLDVSLSTIRSWEQEKSAPSHEMLVALCRLYNVSSDYLLGLSNVDPIFSKNACPEQFTDEEAAELKRYKEYLVWKRKAR